MIVSFFIGKEIIEGRQVAIQQSFDLLKELSKDRLEILQVKHFFTSWFFTNNLVYWNCKFQNSLQLFDFYSECEDFNKWMKDKSKSISVEEDVTKATKSFQNFLKDFSVNKKRLEQIEENSKNLEYIFPELNQEISARVKDVKRSYDSLVKQQDLMEKKLEGSASVIYFQKSCKHWSFHNLRLDDFVAIFVETTPQLIGPSVESVCLENQSLRFKIVF